MYKHPEHEQLKKGRKIWFKSSSKGILPIIIEPGPFSPEKKEEIKKVIDEWYKK